MRYPADTQVDIEDFRRLELKTIIGTREHGYSSMWQSLSAAAKTAIESGNASEGKVLWLLADACSMKLHESSTAEPFGPMMNIGGNRSAIPEDFQTEIAFFAQIAPEIDDTWLKARIADLVWLLEKPRNPKHALMAIDAYRMIPLNTETWLRGGRECWKRAINLARMLKVGAGERLSEMEADIIVSFETAKAEDGFLALWLADLLEKNALGYNKRDSIATKLESLARESEAEGELFRARQFYEASANWFKRSEEPLKTVEMTACVAECWVKHAIERLSSAQPSHMVAAFFYENAIQTYRSIPRKMRAAYRVDERIAELRMKLSESGQKSLEEMSLISSPAMDIKELIEQSQDAIRNKTMLDALATFANIYHGARVNKLKEFSEKILREHPLQSLMSSTHMSRDGRVIARRPGMGFGDVESDEYKSTIWAEMVKHYTMELGIVVQGFILPAMGILSLEHRLSERDFVALANESPVVPKDRARIFGKGLFAGYDGDFISAIHILTPQIENMVRYHLKANGVKTTNIDAKGIENENGLSALVELTETEKIFGKNLSFELRALFCDALGPNLRNEIAHGLLDETHCQSTHVIYAWWFAFKLVFNTYWNANRKMEPEGDSPGKESQK